MPNILNPLTKMINHLLFTSYTKNRVRTHSEEKTYSAVLGKSLFPNPLIKCTSIN